MKYKMSLKFNSSFLHHVETDSQWRYFTSIRY